MRMMKKKMFKKKSKEMKVGVCRLGLGEKNNL
jgi:phage shock protein PspC (stress-responsive transcriptional regulator)